MKHISSVKTELNYYSYYHRYCSKIFGSYQSNWQVFKTSYIQTYTLFIMHSTLNLGAQQRDCQRLVGLTSGAVNCTEPGLIRDEHGK